MEEGDVSETQSVSSQNSTNDYVKHSYSAKDVADAFVKQYYNILQTSPQDTHRFYKDKSILAHPSADGSMKLTTTLKDIDDEIMGSNVKEWDPDLSSVHAQDSIMESVIVGVTGSLTDNDDVTKHFAHTFFLAPQEGGGFYVHNDFLQVIEMNKISETSPSPDASPHTVPQVDDAAKESSLNKDQTHKLTSTTEDDDSSKVKTSVPAKPNKKSEPLASHPSIQDAKRVSYASIVAKEGPPVVASTPQVSSTSVVARALPNADRQSMLSLPVIKATTTQLPTNNVQENIHDVRSVRIKDLPPDMTPESLEEAVKIFGPVKNKNIQIKEYSEDGYRYAFVEFDNPKSARSAVEARFIEFEDRECEIQYKRKTFIQGRGGWGRDGGGGGGWGRYNEHEHGRDYNYRRNSNRFFQDHPRCHTS